MDMADDFEKLSKQIVDDSGDVKKALDEIKKSAEDVDKAYEKLSKTQKSSLEISDKFLKALNKSNDALVEVRKAGVKAALGFRAADRTMKSITVSMSAVGKASGAVSGSFDAAGSAADRFASVVDKSMAAASSSAKSVSSSMKATAKSAKALSGVDFGELMRKQVKDASDELEVLESSLDSVSNQKRYVELSIKVKQMEAFSDVVDELDDVTREAIAASVAAGHLEEEMVKAATTSDLAGVKMAKAYKMGESAAKAATSSAAMLDKELNKQARTLGGLIKKSFLEGKKEAMEFAGGMGESAKGLTAAGLATYFLAGKVEELSKAFGQTAVDIATFNSGMAVLGKTIVGTTSESLEKMRKGLKLTIAQSKEFFSVVKDGANTLGLTQKQMTDTAVSLESTFGGDPTERLRTYVDLLKEIPTLDLDLQVGANLDDRAASLFALAKRGKIDVAMELQTAGLLGGQAEEVPGAEMLKAQQKAQYTTEAIGETLINKIYPSWGPYLSESAEGISKIVGYVGAVSAFLGGMQMFLGTAQNRTTMAVQVGAAEIVRAIGVSGMGGPSIPGRAGSVFKKVGGKTPGVGRMARRAALKYGGKGSAQAVMKFEKALESVTGRAVPAVVKSFGAVKSGAVSLGSKVLSLGKAFNIAAVATVAVGLAAKYLEKKFDESGNEIGAASAKATSALAEVAGAALLGAAIGTIFGPVGTAVGAAVGALAGMAMSAREYGEAVEKTGKALQATVTDFDGRPIQKYNGVVTRAGKVMQKMGEGIGRAVEGVKDFGSTLWDGSKMALSTITGLGDSMAGLDDSVSAAVLATAAMPMLGPAIASSIAAYGLFTKTFQSSDYRQHLHRLVKETKLTEKAFKGMRGAEKKWLPTQQKMFMEEMKSYQALQQSFAEVDAAAHSAKIEMYDFNKEMAMVDVSGLSEMGGSAAVFSAAIGDASDAVKGRFEAMNKALDGARKNIMANDAFSPSERRKALANLNKVEMDAAREFANGMMEVIDSLYKAPALIESGLKRKTAQVEMETAGGGGALTTEDILDNFDKQMKESQKTYDGVAEARKKSDDEIAKIESVMAGKRKAGQDELAAMYDAADAKRKESLKGVVKQVKGKDGTKTVVASQEELAAEYTKVNKASKDLLAKQDELKNSLPKTLLPMAQGVGNLQKSMEKGKKALEGMGEERAKAAGDPKKLKELQEQEKTLKDEQAGYEKELAAKQKLLNDALETVGKRAGESVDSTKLAAYLSELAANNGKLSEKAQEKWAKEMPGMTDAMEKIAKNGYANAEETVKQIDALKEQLNETQALETVLKKASGAVDDSVIIQTAMLKNAEEFKKAVDDDKDSMRKTLETRGTEVQLAEREVEYSKNRLELAKKTGGGVEAIGEMLKKENAYVAEELTELKKKEKVFRGTLEFRKKAVADAEKALAAANAEKKAAEKSGTPEAAKAAAAKVKVLADNVTRLKTIADNAASTVKELDDKIVEVADRIPMVGSVVDRALQELEGTSEMVGARIQSELGDVLADLAPYAKDVGKYADDSFKAASEGAKKEAELKRKVLKASLEEERASLEMRKRAANTPEQVAAVGAQEAALNAKEQAAMGRVELEEKKGVVDAAKRSVQLRMDELDVVQSGVEAQMEVAEAFDGSAAVVGPILEKQLNVEKERLAALKKQAAVSRRMTGDSLETRKLEAEVVRKEGEVRKKEYENVKKVIDLRREEVSMQEDMLETEMDFLQEFGGSLGAIQDMQAGIVEKKREEVALAQAELDAAVANHADGKVMMEAQMKLRKAEIALQRKAMGAQKSIMDRMLGAAFGQISGVGAQKGIGSVQSELGVAGTRVQYKSGLFGSGAGGDTGTIEERTLRAQMGTGKQSAFAAGGSKKDKMEADMERVRDATDTTAENTSGLNVAGSAYVHDIHSESILTDILGVLTKMAGSVSGTEDAVSMVKSMPSNMAAEAGIGSAGGAAAMVPMAVGSGGRGPGGMSEMTPPGGAGAAAAGVASGESITVKGEIKVHFDSKMFRTEMATLVAEVSRTPEFLKSLANSGFITVQQ